MVHESLIKEVNIPELVKALRERALRENEWYEHGGDIIEAAAAAIEALEAEETRLLLVTSDLQDKLMDLQEQLNDSDVAAEDDRRQIEKLAKRNAELHAELEKWVSAAEGLQAEVNRLELDNEDYEHEHRRLKGDIEALQAEQKKTVTQIFGEEQMAWEGRCKDLMKQISELQAEVDILKVCGREAYFEGLSAQPHWVSVEEPPKDGQECIVAYLGPTDWIYEHSTYHSDLNKALEEDIFIEGTDGFIVDGDVGYARHSFNYWMPIEPPQEVQE